MTTYKRWPIGLQSGPTGKPNGIGLVIDALTNANIAMFSASSDATSVIFDLQEARRRSGVPHTANWIPTGFAGKDKNHPGYHLSVPEYGKPHSRQLAIRHWNAVENYKNGIPKEIDWDIPCIWLSTWNEVRPYVGWAPQHAPTAIEDPVAGYAGNADLIGWQAYEIGKEALNRGYRWAAFGFAGGNPEEGFWEAPGVRAYLQLCHENPDQLGVALHEYSLQDTIVGNSNIGRFQQLHAACDKFGLRHPVIQIKEFGWRERWVPKPETAIPELVTVARMYMQHPNIHGAAIWTVQNGWDQTITNQVQDLIPHLQTAGIAHAQPIPAQQQPTVAVQPVVFAAAQTVEPERPFAILAANADETNNQLTANNNEFGIDVSHWQKDLLDWKQLKKDGVRFAYIRVGSGHMRQDPNYIRNVTACLRQDIPFGNYFYLYEDVDMQQQARLFVHQADWRSSLPPALDIEQANLTAAQIETFITEFHRLVDAPPIMIYTRAGLWNRIVPKSVLWPRKHPLWVAHWGTNKPLLPHHWNRWLFFQPGVKEGLAGYPHGPLDYNHFNGPISELTQINYQVKVRVVAFNDFIPFDSPVGNREQRQRKEKMYPGAWFDANPFGNRYTNPDTGKQAYHTGSDLNKNDPHWEADELEPVYAAAEGVVTFAGTLPVWGGIIVIKHDANLYSRYGHVTNITVEKNDLVRRGQKIAQVGQSALGGNFHLHFDISQTAVLEGDPGHWPGLDLAELKRNYVDPRDFIERHRPQETTPPATPRLPKPDRFGFVTAKFLNFRSEASAAGGDVTIIATLKQNTKVGIYNQLANGWYHVRVGDQEGFVSGKFIAFEPVAEPQAKVVFNLHANGNLPKTKTAVGIHASADGGHGVGWRNPVQSEINALKPEVIKFQSSHSEELIGTLVNDNKSTVQTYIVRAFLDWGSRPLTSQQFISFTLSDTIRSVNKIKAHGIPGSKIIVELHNEPNLNMEGLDFSWPNGTKCVEFFAHVLDAFKGHMPDVQFGLGALSPGGKINGVRRDSKLFLDEMLQHPRWHDFDVHLVHVYTRKKWDDIWWVDHCQAKTPHMPIWITESSWHTDDGQPGKNYAAKLVELLSLLDKRPTHGITFYCVSASNPDFYHEAWCRGDNKADPGQNVASRGIAQEIRELRPLV